MTDELMERFCAREQILCKWKKTPYCPLLITDHAPHAPKCQKLAANRFDNDAEIVAKVRRARDAAESKSKDSS